MGSLDSNYKRIERERLRVMEFTRSLEILRQVSYESSQDSRKWLRERQPEDNFYESDFSRKVGDITASVKKRIRIS